MLKNLKQFPFFVLVTMFFAIVMLVPAYYAWNLGLTEIRQAFVRSSLMILITSYLIGVLVIDRGLENRARENLFAVIQIYFVLPFILAIPLWQAFPWENFWQAPYEMLSSLTTTGATLVTSASNIQLPLLVYTTLVAWFGGFLILLLAFAIFEPANMGGFEMVHSIASSTRVQMIGEGKARSNRFLHYAEIIAVPYFLVTAIGFVAFSFSGERTLFALIEAMSAISTSGIDPYFGQMPKSHIFPMELIIYTMMAVGATRHFWLYIGRWRKPGHLFFDPEVRTLTTLLLAFTGYAFVVLLFAAARHEYFGQGLLDALKTLWGAGFTALSFITTHGVFSRYWQFGLAEGGPQLTELILLGFAIIGGGVATTAAGVKLLRVYALYKLSAREIARIIEPSSIASSGNAGRTLRKEGAIIALVYFLLFLFALILTVLLLTLAGMGLTDAILAAIMSASNCGPVAELFQDVMIDMRHMHPLFYIVSGLAMIIGRIEVLVVVTVCNPSFWRER